MNYINFCDGSIYFSNGSIGALSISQISCKNHVAKKHLHKIKRALCEAEKNRKKNVFFTFRDVMEVFKKDMQIFEKANLVKDMEALNFINFPNSIQNCLISSKTSCIDLNFSIVMSCIKKYMENEYLGSSFNSVQKADFLVNVMKHSNIDVKKLLNIRDVVEEVYAYFGANLIESKVK